MADFFPRDPAKALDELRETFYSRIEHLEDLRRKVHDSADRGNDPDWNYGFAGSLYSEITWLRDLLDKMERS